MSFSLLDNYDGGLTNDSNKAKGQYVIVTHQFIERQFQQTFYTRTRQEPNVNLSTSFKAKTAVI